MLCIEVIQYIPPDGGTRKLEVFLPDGLDLADQYELIKSCDLRFTIETLMTGVTSLCLENPELGDYRAKLFTHRDHFEPLIELIREFDPEDYTKWVATETRMQNEGPEEC